MFYRFEDIGPCFLQGQEHSAPSMCWLSIKGSVSVGDGEAWVWCFLSVPKAGIFPTGGCQGEGNATMKEEKGNCNVQAPGWALLFALSKGQRHLWGAGREGVLTSLVLWQQGSTEAGFLCLLSLDKGLLE